MSGDNGLKDSSMRYIWKLGLPIAIQSAFLAMIGLVDVFMVSPLGETALSSTGVGARWLSFISLLIFTFSSASQVLLAQYKGSGNSKGFNSIAYLSSTHLMLFSSFVSIAFLLFPEALIGVITNSLAGNAQAISYLQVIGVVLFLTGVSVSADTIFRSMGETRLPLKIYGVEFGLNVVLNYILIFGALGAPALGVFGAGVASLISRGIRTLILLALLMRKYRINMFSLEAIRISIDKSLTNKFYGVAWPLIASALIWTSGAFIMHAIIGHLGPDELAVMSLVTPFETVAVSFVAGVCCGAAISIGHALGASEFEHAEQLSRNAGILSIIVGSITAVAFCMTAYVYVLMQNSLTQSSAALILSVIPVMGLSILARTITSTQMHGILKSGGDTKFCLYVDLISQWVIAIPTAMFFGIYLGYALPIVYLIIQLEELAKILPCQARIFSNKWSNNLVSGH